jgi:glycosyltransferase involved in cell wall biosynthesis
MRWLQARAGNVICVSSFLARHFLRQGCNVLRIPPLAGLDAEPASPSSSKHDAEGMSLVYAGSPGRKELLTEIIAGVAAARHQGVNVRFEIVGISPAQLPAVAGWRRGRRAGLDGIVCHGRLPRPDAMRIVAGCDYTILLRPQKRFANAGFPSKLVESLSLGVPVLANETSDIAEYVRDGVEGFLLRAPTAAALEEAIMRASALSSAERDAMRANARSRALECFDFRLYVNKLDEFLSSARVCA